MPPLDVTDKPGAAALPPLVGRVEFGVGEGLAGWVARNRRPAFIREHALADPRMKYVPELEEEEFSLTAPDGQFKLSYGARLGLIEETLADVPAKGSKPFSVAVQEERTSRVQEVHATILHVICELVEMDLNG